MRLAPAGRLPLVLAGLAALGSAIYLLVLMHPLTFTLDDWDFLVDRRDWTLNSFLEPHNEHISVIPVAVYKVLVSVFGMTSALPFQVALTVCTLACALLVWMFVRRRLGDWLALAAILPLLFLGSGAINLIYQFQVTMMSSLAFGLAALVALDRGHRRADPLVCAALTASVISGSPGLPFVVAVAAAILLAPDRWNRAYVFLIPGVVYAIWWVGWGVGPDYPVTFSNFTHIPVEVFEGYASSIGSLVGLTIGLDGDAMSSLTLGRPLLVLLLLVGMWRVWRLGSFPRGLLPVLALGIAFWALLSIAAAHDPRRPVTDGRYQYLGAVFVILAVAELYRGARAGRAATAVALAVSVFAVVGNVRAFDTQFFKGLSGVTRVNLGATDIAGSAADPTASPLKFLQVGPYLEAADQFGSPGYTEAEIAEGDEAVRVGADQELASLYGLEGAPAHASAGGARECTTLAPGTPATRSVGPGVVVVEPQANAALALRRFADPDFPVDLGSVSAAEASTVSIPADRSSVAWTLAVTSDRPARVCTVDQG